MKERICIIGIDRPEYEQIRQRVFGPIVWHPVLPKMVLKEGQLLVERSTGIGMLPVDKVIFHGIFEDDHDFIAGLAMWGGPCFPNAFAMMNCRLKLPCLVRAIQYSKFGKPWKGYASPGATIESADELVAKWGNWHCGENKERFSGYYENSNSAIIEPFYEGTAMRLIIIGDQYWQIKMEGKGWLKSIHPDEAHFVPIDEALLEDTRNIKKAFNLEIIANDYIVAPDGQRFLLEVNHIPNLTRFPELWEAYLEVVVGWLS